MCFCHVELMAILAVLPGLGYLFNRLHLWLHRRKPCEHSEACEAQEAHHSPVA